MTFNTYKQNEISAKELYDIIRILPAQNVFHIMTINRQRSSHNLI